MTGLTIRRQIVASFLLVLAVISVMAAASFYAFERVQQESDHIDNEAVQGLLLGLSLTSAWGEEQRLAQTLAQEKNEAERRHLLDFIKNSRADIERLMRDYPATFDSDDDRRNFALLEAQTAPYFPLQEALLVQAESSGPGGQTDLLLSQMEAQFARIQKALENLSKYNQIEAAQSAGTITNVVRRAEWGLGVGFSVAAVLAVLCGFGLYRSIALPLGQLTRIVEGMRGGDFSERLALRRRDEFGELAGGFNVMADELTGLIGQIQKTGIQVNTSITQVAATSKQQQATASEIAATTTEIGATAREISATSSELVRTVGEVSGSVEQTAALAGGGQEGLVHMENTMRRVMDAAGAINTRLAVLSEKAGNINQMVTTITKVADQTNLLSLNAAIEAEKAGQYGRGFAVVATEIRRLADQSAASTYDIEQMVKDIQSAVAASVMGMDKFSEEVRRGIADVQNVSAQLSQIIQQVQGVVPRFEAVNEGMQAQATGAEQISEALGQLSEAAQQTVQSLRQSSAVIDDLSQVSSGLRGSIARFKLKT